MSNLIVNYADGGFIPGQIRLTRTCSALGHTVVCYGKKDGFTPHGDYPYYFKVDALVAASRKASVLLWADASVWATGKGSLDPIFERIESEGYYLSNNGFRNHEWCNDASLAAFGYTRDDAEKQCQVAGGIYGINVNHPTGKLILAELIKHKPLFKGSPTNDRKTESQDCRCKGHRHDQSVLSLIAAKYSLRTPWPDEQKGWYYGTNPDYLLNINAEY